MNFGIASSRLCTVNVHKISSYSLLAGCSVSKRMEWSPVRASYRLGVRTFVLEDVSGSSTFLKAADFDKLLCKHRGQ